MSASRFRRCDGGGGVASTSAASDASARSSGAPESPVGAKNAPARGGLLRWRGCGRRSRNSTGDEAGAAMGGEEDRTGGAQMPPSPPLLGGWEERNPSLPVSFDRPLPRLRRRGG